MATLAATDGLAQPHLTNTDRFTVIVFLYRNDVNPVIIKEFLSPRVTASMLQRGDKSTMLSMPWSKERGGNSGM